MHHYRPLIQGALAEHQLPADLIYLALIESGYRNEATSRAGAAGMWQFMPATARSYGLEVSAYVDERRDPIRSTYAAARHLADLHREFGSWHTAAAAYNAGQGRVGGTLNRTVGRARGSDLLYWQGRSRLPRETRDHVPKLLAAARVAGDPIAYGLNPDTSAPPLRFREMRVPGGTALDTVAHRLGLMPSEVYRLNPHLVRKITPPGRRWPVRIPVLTQGSHS
jgi:membrane-bound lytic murein transglycosylase D